MYARSIFIVWYTRLGRRIEAHYNWNSIWHYFDVVDISTKRTEERERRARQTKTGVFFDVEITADAWVDFEGKNLDLSHRRENSNKGPHIPPQRSCRSCSEFQSILKTFPGGPLGKQCVQTGNLKICAMTCQDETQTLRNEEGFLLLVLSV